MAKGNYSAALSRVLAYEGGKVDDPRDPGGRTNMGVTQRVYDAYRRRKGLATQDVYNISQREVSDIYKTQYWDKIRGDDLPPGVDLVVFDGAVNSGPVQAAKWLQRSLGVAVDGAVGQVTLQAAEQYPDQQQLIDAICDRRLAFLRALSSWSVFGRGWTSRVASVRSEGHAMAAAGEGAAAGRAEPAAEGEPAGEGIERAPIEDARRAPGKGLGDALLGGGVAATALAQAAAALTPLSDHVPSIRLTVAVLTAIGGLAAVGGLLYRQWAVSRQQALADALDLPQAVHPTASGLRGRAA